MMAEFKAWVMIPKLDKKSDEIIIDMRPLVLCKECKYYLGKGYCNRSGIHLEVNDDWFCADGEQK